MIAKMDPILQLLFIGMIFFALLLVAVDKFFASDGQMFQVIANVLSGFVGAFFAKIKTDPSASTTDTVAHTLPTSSPTPNSITEASK